MGRRRGPRCFGGLIGAGVVALLLALPAAAAASSARISPIESVFIPAKLATQYSVTLTGPAKSVHYRWTLKLTLVDPAGSPSPAAPDARAAVDPTCNNAYLPGGDATGTNTYAWTTGATFIWYHGDKGSYPGSGYGCDHTKMGPSGHEGVISVVVTGHGFRCTASIRGTNLTLSPAHGSAPLCRTLGKTAAAPPPATTTTATTTAVTTAPTATAASSSGSGFPLWIPIVVVLVLLVAGGVYLARKRGTADDDCADLVARCRELRAAAEAALTRAGAADAAAKTAQADLAHATAARQSAAQAAQAADHPTEGSWMEDADTGERITEHDLALQKAGDLAFTDPAQRAELRRAEQAKAHAALASAQPTRRQRTPRPPPTRPAPRRMSACARRLRRATPRRRRRGRSRPSTSARSRRRRRSAGTTRRWRSSSTTRRSAQPRPPRRRSATARSSTRRSYGAGSATRKAPSA